MSHPAFASKEEAEAALEKLEEDLLEGRISEAEYKAKKEEINRQIKLLELEEKLIEGQISEEEYKREKARLLGEAPPAPEEAVEAIPEEVQKIFTIAKKLKDVREKREKLRELLLSKEISEPTFQKLDAEYEEKESVLIDQLKKLEETAKERLETIEKRLEGLKLEQEELKARFVLEEISKAEYDSKVGTIETEVKRLTSEKEEIERAIKLLEEEEES